MYVKILNNEVDTYPYSLAQLSIDNKNVSFPKINHSVGIPDNLLSVFAEYGVYPCGELERPSYNRQTQLLTKDSEPKLVNGAWCMGWTITEATSDDLVLLTATEARLMRDERNTRLAATDWVGASDVTMSPEYTSFRQSLRDVPAQGGFPYSITWPTL